MVISFALMVSFVVINGDQETGALGSKTMSVNVQAREHKRVPLLLGVMGKQGALFDVAEGIKKDLEFFGQFSVEIERLLAVRTKHEMQEWHEQGYQFALFMSQNFDGAIEWRVYDTQQALMLKGKKYIPQGSSEHFWAHTIADEVVNVLTGMPGFFSTKIAYCKDVKVGKKKYKHVCVASFDGSNENVLVTTPTINIAPRWNRDYANPLLFYSESTNSNIRLMTVNMNGQRRIASNFDGLNMLPSFTKDGKKVVYCISRGGGSCQIYFYEKGKFKRLTKNNGNNVSPAFSDEGDKVFLCSDFETGHPQIYAYDVKTEDLERITASGYCTSPSYCSRTGKVAYSKMVSGLMQLFVYDTQSKTHTQLTSDTGNKDECSWSPCGNYLLYSVEKGRSGRLAMLNVNSLHQRFITSEHEHCSYPNWSPAYTVYA